MANELNYELLYRISRGLHDQNLNLNRTLQTLIAMTSDAINADHGCLMTFRDYNTVENAYIVGATSEDNVGRELWESLLQRGLVGYVYHSDRTVVIRNIGTDPRWPQLPENKFFPENGSAIALPLSKGSYILGTMLFIHPDIDYFTEERATLLEEIAKMASSAISNALDLNAARTSDTRYYALFDDAVVPIILTDKRGYIIDTNQKVGEMLGKERGDLLRTPIIDLHPDKDTLENYQIDDLDYDAERSFRTTINSTDNPHLPIMIRMRRIILDGRDVIEWVLQDFTAQMELEQLRRDLTAMVYHDLRGPLQAILGSIYKLGDVLQNHENPAVLKLLQLGIRSTRQLHRLVESLLDVQRLEEGKAILNKQSAEVRVLLTDAIQLAQPLAMQAEQHLKLDMASDLPLVNIDNDMVMRVVINLIENAIKYTPDGGNIIVGAKKAEDGVVISIKDSGPGIPEHMKQQIFDKFSRVKYTEGPKGVGLGLAFCRLAVEAHKGRIWVESEDGNGSEFLFTVPFCEEAASDAADLADNLATA